MHALPCAEPDCVLFADEGKPFCGIHATARRVKTVMAGEKCLRCGTAIRAGEWVTRDSTPLAMNHAVCSPRGPEQLAARPGAAR